MAKEYCKPLPSLTQKDIDRFWKYVDKFPGQGPKGACWPWMAAVNHRGYGILQVSGVQRKATRISYFIHYGQDPYPLFVCHTCDWPPCVRGEHLFRTTNSDNQNDCVSKGRNGTLRGSLHIRALFSDDDILQIATMWNTGESQYTIADRLNASQATISLVLLGKRYRSEMQKALSILGVPLKVFSKGKSRVGLPPTNSPSLP